MKTYECGHCGEIIKWNGIIRPEHCGYVMLKHDCDMQPTLQLQYRIVKDEDTCDYRIKDIRIYQQLHLCSCGEKEWRDIPNETM